tara:strand:+ start:535 stop:780 length:246 start_codon:yes stop_codon:yes gene_type:complete
MKETLEEAKDLNYWKNNAEEDYLKVPISVLRYITELEKQQERSYSEEEVVSFIHKFIKEHQPQLPYLIGGINMWFQQYKKK